MKHPSYKTHFFQSPTRGPYPSIKNSQKSDEKKAWVTETNHLKCSILSLPETNIALAPWKDDMRLKGNHLQSPTFQGAMLVWGRVQTLCLQLSGQYIKFHIIPKPDFYGHFARAMVTNRRELVVEQIYRATLIDFATQKHNHKWRCKHPLLNQVQKTQPPPKQTSLGY